jgi:hypothetical protein
MQQQCIDEPCDSLLKRQCAWTAALRATYRDGEVVGGGSVGHMIRFGSARERWILCSASEEIAKRRLAPTCWRACNRPCRFGNRGECSMRRMTVIGVFDQNTICWPAVGMLCASFVRV